LLPDGAGAVTVPEGERLPPGTTFRPVQERVAPPAVTVHAAGAQTPVNKNPVGAERMKAVTA
jgi:hypothetical protein